MISPARKATSSCLRSLYASPISSFSLPTATCTASPFNASSHSINNASPAPCRFLHLHVNSRISPLLPKPSLLLSVRMVGSYEADQGEESEAEKKRSAQLLEVAEQLKFDLNHVLTTKIDFINNPVYHDNIILEDNIRRQTFGGLLEYMKNCNILKIVTHVKFAFSRMNLGTVTVNPTTGLIRIEWNITGMGMTRLGLRYIPDKLWRRENIDRTSPVWISGVSKYFVDDSGKVFKHVIDPPPTEK